MISSNQEIDITVDVVLKRLQQETYQPSILHRKNSGHLFWTKSTYAFSLQDFKTALQRAAAKRRINLLNRIIAVDVYQTKENENWTSADIDDYLNIDCILCCLNEQIQRIEKLQTVESSTTMSSSEVSETIEGLGCLSCLNEPTSALIQLEKYFETDSHFLKQPVYQKICSTVDQLVEITEIRNPRKLLEEMKTELVNYWRKRFKIKNTTPLQILAQHYTQARLGALLKETRIKNRSESSDT